MFNEKMFRPIAYDELEPGTKYKIGFFTGIFVQETWLNPESEHPTMHDLYIEFVDVKIGNLPTWRRFFSPFTMFYQFVPQNPQWKMERRAVNLIVRRLIGDDNFEW